MAPRHAMANAGTATMPMAPCRTSDEKLKIQKHTMDGADKANCMNSCHITKFDFSSLAVQSQRYRVLSFFPSSSCISIPPWWNFLSIRCRLSIQKGAQSLGFPPPPLIL